MAKYTPPDSHNVVFNFEGDTYTPPDSHNVVFNFGQTSNTYQYVTLTGFNTLTVGQTIVQTAIVSILPLGFDSFAYGGHALIQSRFIAPTGFNASALGNQNIWNFNKNVKPTGFNALSIGTATIYNLRQYLNLVTPSRGFNAATYGSAYVQGGVKYVDFNSPSRGFNAAVFGATTVINTKADQFANLNTPSRGIAAPAIPNPNVSPRILYPNGVLAWQFGMPLVQRNPSPLGFTNSSYGTAWVSHNPRYLLPAQVEAFLAGHPKVFDPTQKIYLADKGITGGIFGDIAIRNTRRIITVSGSYTQQFGDWSSLESNRRSVSQQGFNAQAFGAANIYNKTPSIAPNGLNALAGLHGIEIGYRVRTIKPSGWYQPKFGTQVLTKPPEIKPNSINQSAIGTVFISNKTRHLYAGLGKDSQVFGSITVWLYTREFRLTGIKIDAYGAPRIEHGRRTLLLQGSAHTAFGNNAWLSYAVRAIAPISINYPNIPIHYVGRHQEITPNGFVATLFGSRIIPESQSVYPQGFINPLGLAVVDLWKKYLKPNGFLSVGQESGHRFGAAKFWNKRQYIVQVYDGDNGLTPPKWSIWTRIENRNKTIGAIGSNFARVAGPQIDNKAKPLLPVGLNALGIGNLMIADRIRYLKLDGLEAPYIASWSVVYNYADVIATTGVNTQQFGVNTIANTRRYYPRVGNFESLRMGLPMIADRIRMLAFESRYSIHQPPIPLPRMDLYTRYIEEVGRFDDHQIFGNALFSIRWNIITPRWTHREYFGEPRLHNVTPELGVSGRNSEEFGNAFIRLQWRPVVQKGSESIVWGRPDIAFRDRQFAVTGFTQWKIPTHTVTKTGQPPYTTQFIYLNIRHDNGGDVGNGSGDIVRDGDGIEIPSNQVPAGLNVKSNVIHVVGDGSAFSDRLFTVFGAPIAYNNGIRVEPGIHEYTVGEPTVELNYKRIVVKGIDPTSKVGEPNMSPLHIRHASSAPINFSNNTKLEHKHRRIAVGGSEFTRFGGHKINLWRRYLQPTGLHSLRYGWSMVSHDIYVEQFDSYAGGIFGTHTVYKPHESRAVKPLAIPPPNSSVQATIQHYGRTIRPIGTDMQAMGTFRPNDSPFMWRGLRIGPLVKGNYGGFESQIFGTSWISNKIRELNLEGFDSFAAEYDYTKFKERMRVKRQELPLPQTILTTLGFDHALYGVPNIKPAAHYIRPDGNADQYRKGAF